MDGAASDGSPEDSYNLVIDSPEGDKIEVVTGDLPIDAVSTEGGEGDAESENTDDLSSALPVPANYSRDLVPLEPLALYLKEISKYAPLTRDEEHSLAVKYYNDKDLKAAYKLITSNLWLVVKLAREYEQATRNLLDLVQEGNIGLMEAVKNFDPYRGVRLPSYAVWWIKAYIVRYLIANWRLVKIGTTQAQRKLFFNLKKEKDRLEREGIAYSPKLLADRLDVKESDVVEMEQRLGHSDLSVDSPIKDEPGTSLHSILPSDSETAEEILAKTQLRAAVERTFHEFSTTLKEKELAIFNLRLLAEEKATLQEMSDQLGISKERVRQIENRIKEKLKAFMLEKLGSTIEQLEF